jgi:monothiol glutaredoxin
MSDVTKEQNWVETFKADVASEKVFLYIKGEKGAPACGFSNQVMQIFDLLEVDYKVRNILPDPAIREELSAFSRWPTIPQIFIDGEFVGGCDIVTEMYQNGDLK